MLCPLIIVSIGSKINLGSTKDSLLLSSDCERGSTSENCRLLWRFSEIYWVRHRDQFGWQFYSIFLSNHRTFGFDEPCESVHFQKTRLLFYKAEHEICLAMVQHSNQICLIRWVNTTRLFRHCMFLWWNAEKKIQPWWNITMKISTIESCNHFFNYPIAISL